MINIDPAQHYIACVTSYPIVDATASELVGALPKFIGGQFAKLVELYLLGEHVQRHRGWPPQPAAALVIIEYGVERRPVPVEKVLVAQRIEVPHPPTRVAQQRIRELV